MVRTLNPEKRENLLAAALKLFVANGVQNTSTAEIAREAGIAAGTLFLYFPTKQDLINALVLKISKDQSETINALLDPSHSARESFFVIWEGSLRWFIENMDAYLYSQQVRDAITFPESIVQETAQNLAYYYQAIQKGLAEGSIKPYALEMIGGFLYQDIVAVMNLIRAQPDPVARDTAIQQGFEIFWNGIKTGSYSPEGQRHAL